MILPAKPAPSWPDPSECQARRDSYDGPGCVCRRYDKGPGFYLIDQAGHAVAFYARRDDAQEAEARTGAGTVPEVSPASESSGAGLFEGAA